MTRDDIIRMAEASVRAIAPPEYADCPVDEALLKDWMPMLERFASLVAAAEREACAKACLLELRDPVVTWQFKLGHMEGKIDCYNAICARRRQYDPR